MRRSRAMERRRCSPRPPARRSALCDERIEGLHSGVDYNSAIEFPLGVDQPLNDVHDRYVPRLLVRTMVRLALDGMPLLGGDVAAFVTLVQDLGEFRCHRWASGLR